MRKKQLYIALAVLIVSSLMATSSAIADVHKLASLETNNQASTTDLVQDPRLEIISERTGMVAVEAATSSACVYDIDYGIYLCPPPIPDMITRGDPEARASAIARLRLVGLLLVPDSTNDRVMAFDPVTGDLLDPDFVPSDPTHLGTPINAILNASSDSILVSDQIGDVVHAYDLMGGYIGVFAPAGGPDPSILDNIRGIALRPNGNLLVTVGGGTNDDAIAEFDTAGNYLGNFVANGSGGLGSPFDVYKRPGDWLVAGIDSDALHRYDLTGAYIGNLTAINTFPEQLTEASNDNVLVANFSGTEEGVVEYLPDGTLVGIYDPPALGGYRGVYELPNGNILTTNGSGVYEIDRAGNVVETKISGVGARFIEYISTEVQPPDLVLIKSDEPDPVTAGEPFTYTLVVANVSQDLATGVVLTDTLPIATGLVAVTPGEPTCVESGDQVICDLDTLYPNDIVTVTLVVTSPIAGSRHNVAVVMAEEGDVQPDNNIAREQTLLITGFEPHSCDVPSNPFMNCSFETSDFTGWITQEIAAPFFPLGVYGAGISPGFGFFTSDPTQGSFAVLHGFDGAGPGAIIVSQDIVFPAGVGELMFDYRAAWNLIDFAPPDAQARFFMVIISPYGGGPPLDIFPVMIADAYTTILDTGNMTGFVDVSDYADQAVRVSFLWQVPQMATGPGFFQLDNVALTLPAIAIDPTELTSTLYPDQVITQTLTISNFGNSTLIWAFTDTLPLCGVSWASVDPSSGSLDPEMGASVMVTFDSSGLAADIYTGTLCVESNDPLFPLTMIPLTMTVEPSADLGLTKTPSSDMVVAGEALTYTLVITNEGPSDATAVTLTDTLPSEVTFVSAVPSQGNWGEAGGVVTCTLGDIASGSSATVIIVVTAPAAGGTITNTAEVVASEYDPNLGNNLVSTDTAVAAQADLALTKTASQDPVGPGGTLTYTLSVSNAGPSEATGVTLTDTLPAGVTFVSVLSSQGGCNETGGVVICDLNEITSGGSATVTIVVTAPAAEGVITNSAEVNANEQDPNMENNLASTETTVLVSGYKLYLPIALRDD